MYDNDIPEETQFILIGDNAVDYDLLERDKIINQMTSTIINCNTEEKFVNTAPITAIKITFKSIVRFASISEKRS